METDAPRCYAISTATSESGLRLVTVRLEAPRDQAGRDQLLTQGVVDLVRYLVGATEDHSTPVAVDVQLGHEPDRAPSLEAFVEAVRGLVQSYVLETQQGIGPLNVVVSRSSQESDRQLTWHYLAGDTGTFSRGATYDLREVTE